jgi:glycosyltransferase involved in cell wall biosynthesis
MKVHVLQHGLEDMHSHYYGESLHLKKAIEDMGAECALYVYTGCEAALVKELNAKPIFRYPADQGFDPDPLSKELSTFVVCGAAFAEALSKHLPQQFAADEWILVPYTTQVEAYGMGMWLNSIPKGTRPKVMLFCHRPELAWRADVSRLKMQANSSFWRWSGHLMAKAVGPDNVKLATGDVRLADFLCQFSTLKTMVSGLATAYFLGPQEQSTLPKDVDVGIVGEFRPERGRHIVAETLAETDRLRPGLTYRIQVMNASDATELRAQLAGLGFQGQLEVVPGTQAPLQFDAMLARCRLAVLPYMPDRYAMRTSGVFSQATAYGVPVVVPDRTWLSDAIQGGLAAGVVFDEWSAPAIARAAVQALNQLPELTALAAELAPQWRLKNSPGTVLRNMMAALEIPLPSKSAASQLA